MSSKGRRAAKMTEVASPPEKEVYTVVVYGPGGEVDRREVDTPFHATLVRPTGLRAALAVLFGRLNIVIKVGGSSTDWWMRKEAALAGPVHRVVIR